MFFIDSYSSLKNTDAKLLHLPSLYIIVYQIHKSFLANFRCYFSLTPVYSELIACCQKKKWLRKISIMAEPQMVDISTLDVQQLHSIKQQLEQELSVLTGSFSSLKAAQASFSESQNIIVSRFASSSPTSDILVPLSASLYVPGTLDPLHPLLIDIGTGYYVEVSAEQAKKYYERKITKLDKHLADLQESIMQKQNQLRIVLDLMQAKMSRISSTATPQSVKS